MDFSGLATQLLSNIQTHLFNWFPNGEIVGNEFQIGSIMGEKGQSLRVNTNTGKWADFADNRKGGDLISLFADFRSISNKEAFIALSENLNYKQNYKPMEKKPTTSLTFINPSDPKTAPCCKRGSTYWTYTDKEGQALFHISRYKDKTGRKAFSPWAFTKEKGWVPKIPTGVRPLYNLQEIISSENILLVEGEKAVEAAKKFVGHVYTVTTWSGGAKASGKTDFTPLNGKNILMWPDADKEGLDAMEEIARKFNSKNTTIKILELGFDYKKGWDAADSNFTWQQFKDWAKPRAQTYNKSDVITDSKEVYKMIPSDYIKANTATQIHQHQHLHINDEDIPPQIPIEVKDIWNDLKLSRTADGEGAQNNIDNITRILAKGNKFKGKIWFDEFHGKILSNWKSRKVYEWGDSNTVSLLVKLQSAYGLTKLDTSKVDKALLHTAYQDIRNEPKDWIKSLEWDGKPRIKMFMNDYFGVKDSDYSQAVSRNWWISMVARVNEPGIKVDNMVILEGKQGAFKSSALNLIGGKWHTETTKKIGTTDFYLSLKGNILIEFAELSSFSKREAQTIKQDITNKVDRYRDPYGRYSKDNPRQCVYVGTTNDSHYLVDDTGARRFWPVLITKIDLKAIKEDREQLFAEAFVRLKSGETWYEVPDSAAIEQEERRETDIWEEYIEDWFSDITKDVDQTFFLTKDVWSSALNGDGDKVDGRHSRRIAKILRMMGYTYKQRRHPVTRKNTKSWGKDELLEPSLKNDQPKNYALKENRL